MYCISDGNEVKEDGTPAAEGEQGKVYEATLGNLKKALIPAVLITMGFVLINVLIAMIISKTCKIDIATAMLSSSAGGASESALVAEDFGADPAIVTVLQITRLVCTTAFYPVIVKLLYPVL